MLPRIVFHHVHKCAGTTVLKHLSGTAPAERSAFVEELVSVADPHGTDRVAALLRAEFVHDPFGVHDWKSLLGDAVDVIFVRDPVERLWSEWRMIARWDDGLVAARGERYVRLREIARRGFAPFLALPRAAAFGNALAAHLAFGEPLLGEVREACLGGGPPPEETFEALDARLTAIDVVGFVERFDDSLAALAARIGCSPPRAGIQSHNVHPPEGISLTPEERRLAEACTVLDRRLVAAARRRAADRGVADRGTLEELAFSRHRARILSAPEAILVDMGDGILDPGWHPCERNGRKRSRWIGPSPVAALSLRVSRAGALAVRVRVGNHLLPAQVDSLRLFADGVELATDHWVLPPFDHFFEATVPAAPGAGDFLHLEIDCGETAAPPDPSDTRRLGVEVGEIEVFPAERHRSRSLAGLARVRVELDSLAATPDGDRRMEHLLQGLPGG